MIRAFDPDADAALLESGERLAFEASYPGVSMPDEHFYERLASIQGGQCMARTFQRDHEPVGYVVFSMERFYGGAVGCVESVYVAPQHRRQGVMRDLLTEVSDIFRKSGATSLVLEVSVSNDGAMKAFEKLGLRTTRYQMEVSLA